MKNKALLPTLIFTVIYLLLLSVPVTSERTDTVKGIEPVTKNTIKYIPNEYHYEDVDTLVQSVEQELKRLDSPLLGYVEYVRSRLNNDNEFVIFFAIANAESGLGRSDFARECFNAWGYLYTGTDRRGCNSVKWSSWEKSIDRFITLEKNKWLTLYDGTDKSLNNYIDQTKYGKYCASGCQHWIQNAQAFIDNINY